MSIDVTANGVDCGVVEWVKCGIMRRFGHVIKKTGDFVRSVLGCDKGRDHQGTLPANRISRADEFWMVGKQV